jgi:hypothetical protein
MRFPDRCRCAAILPQDLLIADQDVSRNLRATTFPIPAAPRAPLTAGRWRF